MGASLLALATYTTISFAKNKRLLEPKFSREECSVTLYYSRTVKRLPKETPALAG